MVRRWYRVALDCLEPHYPAYDSEAVRHLRITLRGLFGCDIVVLVPPTLF